MSLCHNFLSGPPEIAPRGSENARSLFSSTFSARCPVIEICTRLGLALALSLALAVLLAWGWDSSDPLPIDTNRLVEAPAPASPAQ